MAVRAHLLILEVNLSAVRAFHNLACYFYAATWANGCFVTDLMSALRTFYNCHVISKYYLLQKNSCFLVIGFRFSLYRCRNLISLNLCFPINRLLSTYPFTPLSRPFPVYCHISISLPSRSTGSRLVYWAIMIL